MIVVLNHFSWFAWFVPCRRSIKSRNNYSLANKQPFYIPVDKCTRTSLQKKQSTTRWRWTRLYLTILATKKRSEKWSSFPLSQRFLVLLSMQNFLLLLLLRSNKWSTFYIAVWSAPATKSLKPHVHCIHTIAKNAFKHPDNIVSKCTQCRGSQKTKAKHSFTTAAVVSEEKTKFSKHLIQCAK